MNSELTQKLNKGFGEFVVRTLLDRMTGGHPEIISVEFRYGCNHTGFEFTFDRRDYSGRFYEGKKGLKFRFSNDQPKVVVDVPNVSENELYEKLYQEVVLPFLRRGEM